jgi:endonuclease I
MFRIIDAQQTKERMKMKGKKTSERKFKRGSHKFVVDVFWLVAKPYKVEADSREEAREIVEGWLCGDKNNCWREKDVEEIEMLAVTSGEELKDGCIEYFSRPVSILEE